MGRYIQVDGVTIFYIPGIFAKFFQNLHNNTCDVAVQKIRSLQRIIRRYARFNNFELREKYPYTANMWCVRPNNDYWFGVDENMKEFNKFDLTSVVYFTLEAFKKTILRYSDDIIEIEDCDFYIKFFPFNFNHYFSTHDSILYKKKQLRHKTRSNRRRVL
jgi:hypothetical protein